MPSLEFKYSADQEHQTAAVEAVCDLFRGQEFMASDFTAGSFGGLYSSEIVVGHANGLRVSARQLEENLHAVQEENSLPRTSVITDGRLRDFSVEMETGTGKTYVYIRTIYELNKRYGLTKFVIVVPSVAIREGVKKSFESTRKHFEGLYDRKPLEFFVYDSKDMGPVGNFATSASIQVMIINIGAFNKELDKDAKKGTTNIFHRPSENLIGGRSPQELVSACNPIVIIDEPQSVDNTSKAKAAIRSLNPLFVLRYSATHKEPYNKVYQLGPVDAFQRNLVKGIVVDSVLSQEDLNGAYVRLESANSKNGYKAMITIDCRQKDGTQKRKRVTVKTGDDLYMKSGENVDYEDGWVVSNIGAVPGEEFVEFVNGEYLEVGDALGDVAALAVKEAQIARTIEDHLECQLRLYKLGIKVLSLFFIDKVEKYRVYEPEVHNGEYAEIFERKYREIATSKKWQRRYERAGVPLPTDPAGLHQGYFARDGKGKFKDSREGANTSADTSAFELIMKKKETLVSFPDGKDHDKDVAFIFSHSALKEGWDNPNVFQICTLVETNDTLTKRQKIGRGLRLPVNQEGERCYDPDVNVLTVIANESYERFASDLQTEFERDGYRFGIITPESFTKLIFKNADGSEENLGFERSEQIYEALKAEGLITEAGDVIPELKELAESGEIELPEELQQVADQVASVILHKSQKLQIKDKSKQVEVELQKDVTLDSAFQELWERIRQTTRFEMEIDSNELVEKAISEIKLMSKVKPLEVISSKAALDVDDAGVAAAKNVRTSVVTTDMSRVYDLPDPISELQDAVGLTRRTIMRILEGCGRMEEFAIDPMTFLSQVAAKIEAAKVEVMAKGIKYTRLPENDWYTMDILAVEDLTAFLDQNAWEPLHRKSLYNYVIYDSSSVEKPYAMALDQSDAVKVFAKLPSRFKIDTPLGSYNPDWAYVEDIDGKQRVYFVTETKGGGNGTPVLRPSERAKIECAQKHFEALDLGDDFTYNVETTYHYGVVEI